MLGLIRTKSCQNTWIAFPKIAKAQSFAVEYRNLHRIIIIPSFTVNLVNIVNMNMFQFCVSLLTRLSPDKIMI